MAVGAGVAVALFLVMAVLARRDHDMATGLAISAAIAAIFSVVGFVGAGLGA
jgi:hypothetical protein